MGGRTNRINVVIASALAAVSIGGAVPSAFPARAVIRIGVHDYVRLPVERFARAQVLVNQIYRTIDIDTCWHTRRSPELRCGQLTDSDADELFIILLNSEMSERLGAADNVVGVAAVAKHGRGRIAYVLFGRVTVAAQQAAVDPMHVLGLVMAHELAHLLLPPNPHSLTGLMRPGWNLHELREDASPSRFTFTDIQADQIRHRLRQGDTSAIAVQRGSDTLVPRTAEPPGAIEIRP